MGDPSTTKSSELDRSTSRRASTRLSRVLGDGDEDDYDFLAMGISDGFRPVDVAQNDNLSHIARSSIFSLERPAARAVSPRPSSVSKPPPVHDSIPFPSYNNPLERAPVRSSSVSTDSTLMPAETPYEGPSGPSHPYQMYPQDVRLARTASLATTSTAPISERSYNGPRRPAHPYGTYSQNVSTGEDGSSDRSAQRDIPVGFPGTGGEYQRRIGPDGEEAADLIGPDGHTEQLPPYTRYPVEAYAQKALGISVAQPALTPAPAQQIPEIPGAGGIGLATRNPEFSSTEDLNRLSSPESRRSIRSFTSEASHHSINTAAHAVTNEKDMPNWKKAAGRKVWGIIPCWAVALGVLVLVLLGVVVGTVIGTVIAPQLHKGSGSHKSSYSATSTTIGFVPLATVPPGLPPLVEGPYSLPLFGPRFSKTCFKDPSQSSVWNCDAIMAQLTMTVSKRPDSTDTTAYELDLSYNHSYTLDNYVYTYGEQPPSLTNQQLTLVNDTFERARGPAWAFAVPYTKTVILPEQSLMEYNDTTSNQVQRRMMFGPDFKRKGLADSGDKPWICTWPNTLLEFFIYTTQNSSFKFPMPPISSMSAPSSSLPTESPTGARRRSPMGQPNGHDTHRDEEGFQYTSPPITQPPSSSSTTSVPSQTSQASSTTSDYFSPDPMPPPMMPVYPKVIKVEERRNSNAASSLPVCRQVQIVSQGTQALPVLNAAGEPVEVQIAEVVEDNDEKETAQYLLKRHSFGQHLRDRSDDGSDGNELSDCGCIWWVT
ncbi:hypothetical protein GGS24DRAFT_372447 [Hypoxylon argillaceum]|nr:hypothetical protein GGS24DRAFT_372447 [Hypoxylon argillaceum]